MIAEAAGPAPAAKLPKGRYLIVSAPDARAGALKTLIEGAGSAADIAPADAAEALLGPFIGAGLAVLLPEWLRFAEGLAPIIFAVIVMIMVALCPTGIVGLFERIFVKSRRPHADDKGPVLGEVKS